MLQQQAPHVPDERLQELIYSRLARSPHLAGKYLRIEMSDNTIVLKGTVRSYYHKQLAQETLRPLAAGRLLRNELQVVGGR